MFKFETHLHTIESSACAHVPAKDMVALYHDAGYSGMVVTDHLNRYEIERRSCQTWSEAIDEFLVGYQAAKKAGAEFGMDILLGAELMPDGGNNEYLMFGLTEQFLYSCENIYSLPLPELREVCSKNGVLLFQAHPYRDGMTRAMPGFVDGVEVFNGCPRHESRNDLTLKYATKQKLHMSSGSDAHMVEDVGRGGLETSERICSLDQLKDVLMNDKAQLIRNEKKRKFFIFGGKK